MTGLCRRPAQYSVSQRSKSPQKTPVSTTPYLMCCAPALCGQGQTCQLHECQDRELNAPVHGVQADELLAQELATR